jgi:hypothetical protein
MATQLDVVNDCLAVMGEAPLTTLQEDHEYKAAALNRLASENREIQSKGWWFNMEEVKLVADPTDNRIYLPGDTLAITLACSAKLAQRGRVLYNLSEGTDKFPAGTTYDARLTRLVPYEDLPQTAAAFVGVNVVLWFQNQYDGDQTKTRNLSLLREQRETAVMTEHIRNRKVNLLDSNVRLARIRNIIRQGSRY